MTFIPHGLEVQHNGIQETPDGVVHTLDTVNLVICDHCGVLVGDEGKHAAWHDVQQDRTTSL